VSRGHIQLAECCLLRPIPADVLAQNDRLGELPAIADVFDDIMAAVRGEVKATVTTAEVRGLPYRWLVQSLIHPSPWTLTSTLTDPLSAPSGMSCHVSCVRISTGCLQ